ncbi:cytochrome c [uncultured Desulfobacter sp.]|uniref:c-type cytochrome n=1 Tax=uncultured Desulfobacter sp. TaxID=240139 RepID=UPI0029F458F0|nr:cytochrome c [uncultured Desulfobacter sp.]
MKKNNLFPIIFFIVFIMVGCTASLESYNRESCKSIPDDKLFNVLQNNCVSCHKKDFQTKLDICSRKTIIIDAVKNGRMPKYGSISENDKNTIIEWPTDKNE